MQAESPKHSPNHKEFQLKKEIVSVKEKYNPGLTKHAKSPKKFQNDKVIDNESNFKKLLDDILDQFSVKDL
jgi:hypothetical protein